MDFKNDKNPLTINKVNNIIFIYHTLIQSSERSVLKSLLGKKRKMENIRSSFSFKTNTDSTSFSSSSSNNNKSFLTSPLIKELSNFYNMERSICMSCIKTKNKKYPTNAFIPCLPFSKKS